MRCRRERERAVSYTHLDVYKRQVCVCVFIINNKYLIEAILFELKNNTTGKRRE